MNSKIIDKTENATFGAGCFWCFEAIYQLLQGVQSVKSGYAGGHTAQPTYQEVCQGSTGHAEVIQLTYDPEAISYKKLLEVFWKNHDPTTPNRQGNDIGTQYRSIILFHNTEQERLAKHYKKKLDEEKIWETPIVTEIMPLKKFYPAEKYHDNYFRKNTKNYYCSLIITPKLEKFKKTFNDLLI